MIVDVISSSNCLQTQFWWPTEGRLDAVMKVTLWWFKVASPCLPLGLQFVVYDCKCILSAHSEQPPEECHSYDCGEYSETYWGWGCQRFERINFPFVLCLY